MGWIPLLAPEFKFYNEESFYEYVKSLHIPHKPEVKAKRSKKNDTDAKSKSIAKRTRKTKKDAGPIEAS